MKQFAFAFIIIVILFTFGLLFYSAVIDANNDCVCETVDARSTVVFELVTPDAAEWYKETVR